MASFTIQNTQAGVTVDEHASEIHSFCDIETDNEYMWQGDPKYWTGRNPTLFPMVGSTWDKKFISMEKNILLEIMVSQEIVILHVLNIQIIKSLWN